MQTEMVGAEGKRGHKQLITVFVDAPDENKEKIEIALAKENFRLYFRAVGEPKVRVHFAPAGEINEIVAKPR